MVIRKDEDNVGRDADTPACGVPDSPLVLHDEKAKVRVHLNCYLRLVAVRVDGGPGTPFAALLEPDFEYGRAEFHGLLAARASQGSRDVFAFCDGDLLFKVEVSGGEANDRRAAIAAASDAIWRFRNRM